MQALQQLGSGTFGYVFKVRKYGKEYALKVIPFDDRIVNLVEIDLLSRFEHPNLMYLIEMEFDLNRKIMMLLLPLGKSSLSQLIPKKFTPQQKIQYLTQTVSAVHFLHQMGFEHCDLKPENIIVYENKLLVADFGISLNQYNTDSLCLQSAPYRPPEVFDHYESIQKYTIPVMQEYIRHHPREYTTDDLEAFILHKEFFHKPVNNVASDLWALGVIIYFIFTGRRLFEADAVEGTLLKISRYIERSKEILQSLPEGLQLPMEYLLNPKADSRSMDLFIQGTGLKLIPGIQKKVKYELENLDYAVLNPIFHEVYKDYQEYNLTEYEYLGALDLVVRVASTAILDGRLLGKVAVYMMSEILSNSVIWTNMKKFLGTEHSMEDVIKEEVRIIEVLKGMIIPEDLLNKWHKIEEEFGGRQILEEITPEVFVNEFLKGTPTKGFHREELD